MRLRKPCEHFDERHPDGQYEEHVLWDSPERTICPGGEFLPDEALVIHKDADGEWPKWALMALDGMIRHPASYVLGVLAKAAAGDVPTAWDTQTYDRDQEYHAFATDQVGEQV